MKTPPSTALLPRLVQKFFCERLTAQRNASPCTISSYRDTFRLLLSFMQKTKGRGPAQLKIEDFDAPVILEFLKHLETQRGNHARTRNARLAAIRSFMNYAALQEPSLMAMVNRVLAIPMKRFDRPLLGFLSRAEMNAILAAPDASTWSGRRDRVLFTTMYNTGARVSELLAVTRSDLQLGSLGYLQLLGKGRKERAVPLWKGTVKQIKEWLSELPHSGSSAVFVNRYGQPLSRSAVEYRLELAVQQAAQQHPSLKGRSISPHTIRHTTAMHLLQAGIDITVIALWLGHEHPATTHGYIELDLAMKRKTLEKLKQPKLARKKKKMPDSLIAFLESL